MSAQATPRNMAMTRSSSISADLLELAKPRITAMVVITTAAGYWLGATHAAVLPFLFTLLATALIAAGAGCLNQVIEARTDAAMERTRNRPVASGRIGKPLATGFGLLLSVTGAVLLLFAANPLTSALGLLTLLLYTLVYTPMKRVSSLCTIVGAIPGAIPPMMGWTAATNNISVEAWILFGILFFWQMPHFLAIAWMYRDDYKRGEQPMLPVSDGGGSATARQILLYSLGLLPVSLLPGILGMAGPSYFDGAVLLGVVFLASAVHTAIQRSATAARILLRVSVLYLPLLLLLLVATKEGA